MPVFALVGAHFAGVRAIHAVHVGPDGDVTRLEQRAQDGRRVVAAVAF